MIRKSTIFYPNILYLIFILCLLFPIKKVQGQDFNYKVNAMYIYYFAKYINWTEVEQTGSLTIGIIGNSPLNEQLKLVVNNKKVYGKSIIVKNILPAEAGNCNMVVVSKSQTSLTQKVSESIKNLPILLITEKEGYTRKGAQICIYVDDEDEFKTKFELSKSNLEKSNFKVSHELLALGEIVN